MTAMKQATSNRTNNSASPSIDSDKDRKLQCPFTPSEGYTTKALYEEYFVNHMNEAPRVNISDGYSLWANAATATAAVDDDKDEQPLYFWQLYSVLGPERIIEIVTEFYHRVWNDNEEPWFRDAFIKLGAPMEHHIRTQAAYWIDAMGGGRCYHGGEYRLHFHHKHNAAEIMTAAGATRWMYHMRQTLQTLFDSSLDNVDARVQPAILAFLDTKMRSYADQFGWKYNPDEMVVCQD